MEFCLCSETMCNFEQLREGLLIHVDYFQQVDKKMCIFLKFIIIIIIIKFILRHWIGSQKCWRIWVLILRMVKNTTDFLYDTLGVLCVASRNA
jgi:hypothetical protein